MDWVAFFVTMGLFTLLFVLEQRADPTARGAVRYFTVFSILLIAVYVWWYGILREAAFGFFAALVISFLFWVTVGRYNPASSSDDIRVLGMDD
jgi:hypothetical protein